MIPPTSPNVPSAAQPLVATISVDSISPERIAALNDKVASYYYNNNHAQLWVDGSKYNGDPQWRSHEGGGHLPPLPIVN